METCHPSLSRGEILVQTANLHILRRIQTTKFWALLNPPIALLKVSVFFTLLVNENIPLLYCVYQCADGVSRHMFCCILKLACSVLWEYWSVFSYSKAGDEDQRVKSQREDSLTDRVGVVEGSALGGPFPR